MAPFRGTSTLTLHVRDGWREPLLWLLLGIAVGYAIEWWLTRLRPRALLDRRLRRLMDRTSRRQARVDNTLFLIRDRDTKFVAGFDEVFRTDGTTVIQTPFRVPQANAHAERFVRTARTECLDWLLILGPRQVDRVLRVYRPLQHPAATLCARPPTADRDPAANATTAAGTD